MEDNGVADKCMVVPASSPDFNPIECVWGTMKDYLQRVTLPKTKDELMAGIRTFWEQLDADECGKYIDHIHKALPRAVLNHGGSSGL